LSDQKAALEIRKPGFVDLAGSLDQLEKRFKEYQDIKKKILTQDDVVKIGDNEYIKKTGRTKFEVAFNLTTRILEERKEVSPTDPSKFAYHFTVECKADNGRVIQDVGTCDNSEKPSVAEHIIRAMAKTRATSRAVFEMIGAGDISAEEAELIPKKNTDFCQCKTPSTKLDGTCNTCKKIVKPKEVS